MQLLQHRRKIFLALIGIGILVIVSLIISDQRKARLTITSNDQATISASTESATKLEEVGKGKVTIKADSGINIYVEVREGSSVTRGVYSLQPSERKDVQIELKDIIERERISNGPLAHIYLGDEYSYGTDPLSQTLVSIQDTDNPSKQPVDYGDIERIDDVTWINENNFVYDEFGKGVNFFINGSVFDIDNGAEAEFELSPFKQDFATENPKESILVLDGDLLFRSTGVNKSGIKLIRDNLNTTKETEAYSLPGRATFLTPLYTQGEPVAEESITPRSIDSDLEGEGAEDRILTGYRVLLLDYAGTELGEFVFDTDLPVRDVQGYGADGFVFVQQDRVVTLDANGNEQNILPVFYRGVNDVVSYQDDLLLLDESGMWRFDTEAKTLHLLSEYVDDETYSPDSLAIRDGKAIYSVSVIPEQTNFEGNSRPDYLALDAQQNKDRGYIYAVTLE